jgi:hypothetical protein
LINLTKTCKSSTKSAEKYDESVDGIDSKDKVDISLSTPTHYTSHATYIGGPTDFIADKEEKM